ncbi:MAG TPA: division/cell wall cluster transcriptional repressor MraZ [Pseudomonadales bacterium]|nr:division/cell wall cluster transcriptional repressor MraZ [Pseudomonadales bacterium]
MFRGVSHINLDAKGRMAMPAKYRDRVASEFSGLMVMTIDTQTRCLLLYPLATWEVLEKQIQDLPSFDPAVKRFQRLTIGYASDLELDGSGRLLLPQALRDYASLDKKVVLVGQGKKFELWSEEAWLDSRETWLAEEAEGDVLASDALKNLAM